MKAALYARVSLDRQRENYSIPTQLEAMREYCGKNNLEIVKEYIEDESGAKLTRPALDQVREDVAEGLFGILVCHDVDRFGRNLGHQILLEEEFAKHAAEVRYVLGDYKDNPEGRLTKHIKGVIAEYEREKIMERTFRGRIKRAKSGQVHVGNRDPYGYAYKSEQRRGWLEIIPEEAEIVREIYRLYVEDGLSCHEILRRLTARQVPTKTGCLQWSPSTVRGILRNETYAGIWYDNKRSHHKGVKPKESWIPVSVPSIVSRELWDAAQEQIAANRERLRRHPKYPYLLSRMLRGGSCGHAFIGETQVDSRGRRPKAYHYYRCSDNMKTWKHERCQEGILRAEDADALVWQRIAQALSNPELLAREYSQQLEDGNGAKTQKRISEIERELNKLKRQRDRNLDLYAEEEMDMPTLKKKQENLRGQKASLERERKALQEVLTRNNTDMVSLPQFCQFISEGSGAVTFEEKRQILRLLSVEGRVKGGVITLTGCIPSAESYGYSTSHRPVTINNHNIPFVLEIPSYLGRYRRRWTKDEMRYRRRWTKNEMRLLVKLYPVIPIKNLALEFRRTENAIRKKHADCISNGVEIYQQY